MRSLVKVIDQMLCVIPASEGRLIAQLKSNQTSAEYTSPETIGFRWKTTAETLFDRFGDTDEKELMAEGSWTKRLFEIWMNKTLDSPA